MKFNRLLLCVVALLMAVTASGCFQNKLIDHVTFKPSDDLKTIRISLVFSPDIQTDFGAAFNIKQYGSLFVSPFYGLDQPFEFGFDLNTAVFNDQDYVRLTPTTNLPNGTPIGLPRDKDGKPYALAEVKNPNPASSKYDLYAYVDVLHANWLGAAAIFTFMDYKYFPPYLRVTQIFLRDSAGKPGVVGSVFGPSLNLDGSMKTPGGLVLFANIRQLISGHALAGGKETTLRPEPGVIVSGPSAAEYDGDEQALVALQGRLVNGLNSL
ncbi:MAG: hypothetical protein HYW49_05550 [Deltaproteobacteria bacterium]|nr:hypothetical protein [Deltaproteobacteria bacterium]